MASKTINLPPSVSNSLTSYAGQYGVDPAFVQAVAQVESGGQQYNSQGQPLTSKTGAVGIMQIEPATFAGLTDSNGNHFTDINDPNQNMEAGVVYLAQLNQKYGDLPTTAAAYNAGPGAVNKYGGVPPYNETQNYVRNVSMLTASAGSTNSSVQSQNVQKTLNNSNGPTVSTNSTTGLTTVTPLTPLTAYITPVGQSIDPNDTVLANTLTPKLQIDTGLTEVAWFDDANLLTGNPHARKQVQPVAFMVYLNRNLARNQMLTNPSTNKPVVLQLNTSIRTFELQSKHVYNRTPSRTGMHVTFWGMQPDLITGAGTTGVFLNQYGITDYLSTMSINDDIAKLVGAAFSQNSDTEQAINQNPEAYRVAAQDAFVEFMKLFQMNGNVWFHSPSYTGTTTGQQQQGVNAWSSNTGSSSFAQTARNNDVMTRGYVAMRYRNNVYLGYFKSLNWTQDAEKPFTWDFNFVFQVERTITALPYTSQSSVNALYISAAAQATPEAAPTANSIPDVIT